MDFGPKLSCAGRFGYGDGFLRGQGQDREDRPCSDHFCDRAFACEESLTHLGGEEQVRIYLANFDAGKAAGQVERRDAETDRIDRAERGSDWWFRNKDRLRREKERVTRRSNEP